MPTCLRGASFLRHIVVLIDLVLSSQLRHQLKKIIELEFTYSFVSVKSPTDYVMCSL